MPVFSHCAAVLLDKVPVVEQASHQLASTWQVLTVRNQVIQSYSNYCTILRAEFE